jgi:hypothetical protein
VTRRREADSATWRKSSECANGECVEIARRPGRVLLRRSQDPHGVLEFTAAEWETFVSALHRGEFDGPEPGRAAS